MSMWHRMGEAFCLAGEGLSLTLEALGFAVEIWSLAGECFCLAGESIYIPREAPSLAAEAPYNEPPKH